MSSADLYEDGFPHSTPAGYDQGCRGGACPGGLENGMTCAQAKARYNGDYGYRKRVDAGMTPEQIRAEEPAKPATPKPVARKKPEPSTPVAPELTQWPDEEIDPEPTETGKAWAIAIDEKIADQARVETIDVGPVTVAGHRDPTTGKVVPDDEHGTPAGYRHGCRDINCPGVQRVGKSCRRAINDYQAEKRAERVERAAARAAEADAIGKTVAAEAAAAPTDIVPAPPLSDAERIKVKAFGLDKPQEVIDALLADAAETEAPAAAVDDHAAQLLDAELNELIARAEAAPSTIINVPEIPALAEGGYIIGSPEEPIEDRLRRALWEAEAANRDLRAQLRDAETSREVETQRVVVPAAGGRAITITIEVRGD